MLGGGGERDGVILMRGGGSEGGGRVFLSRGGGGFAVGPKGLNWGNRPVAHGGSLAMRPARSAKPA